MSELGNAGKLFILLGILLILIGGLLTLLDKLPSWGGLGWLGKLPGDIYIKRDNFTFYFPITTSILISIILSLLFYVLTRR